MIRRHRGECIVLAFRRVTGTEADIICFGRYLARIKEETMDLALESFGVGTLPFSSRTILSLHLPSPHRAEICHLIGEASRSWTPHPYPSFQLTPLATDLYAKSLSIPQATQEEPFLERPRRPRLVVPRQGEGSDG